MILNCVDSLVYRIFFETLAMTGARPIEMIEVKPEDIDFKEKCIYVIVAKKVTRMRLPKYFPHQLEIKLRA